MGHGKEEDNSVFVLWRQDTREKQKRWKWLREDSSPSHFLSWLGQLTQLISSLRATGVFEPQEPCYNSTLYWACATPRQLTYTFFHLISIRCRELISSTLQIRRLRHHVSTFYKAGCAKAAQPVRVDAVSCFSPTFRTARGHFESTRTAGGGSGGLRALFKWKQSYLQRKSTSSISSEGLLPHPSPRCFTSVIPSLP